MLESNRVKLKLNEDVLKKNNKKKTTRVQGFHQLAWQQFAVQLKTIANIQRKVIAHVKYFRWPFATNFLHSSIMC